MVKRFNAPKEEKVEKSLLEKNLELLANKLVEQALNDEASSPVALAVLKTGSNYLSITKKIGAGADDVGEAFNGFRERLKASSAGGSGASTRGESTSSSRPSAEILPLRVFDRDLAAAILSDAAGGGKEDAEGDSGEGAGGTGEGA